jgi:hypothetical protein
MHNADETQELLALQKRLMDESNMLGWLCTVHRNKVQYKNNPVATSEIQEQLNRASTLISLAYIWALLDEHGFNEHNKWISTGDRLELKAWKHVRHTGAHAPGGRATGYYDEFDDFMQSDGAGTSGLRQNCDYTDTSVSVTDGMNYRFFQYIQGLVQTAIGNCANNIDPDHS